jgi:processive 1,2-diacylglycerol beta-glucosyltransferase
MLRDKDTDREIGTITEAQLRFLQDQLEEETPDDRDYYLNAATLDALAEADGDPQLLALLRGAMGEREEMEIRWTRV